MSEILDYFLQKGLITGHRQFPKSFYKLFLNKKKVLWDWWLQTSSMK